MALPRVVDSMSSLIEAHPCLMFWLAMVIIVASVIGYIVNGICSLVRRSY